MNFKEFMKKYVFGFVALIMFSASIIILVQDIKEDQRQKTKVTLLEKQVSDLQIENKKLEDILIPEAGLLDVMIGIFNKEQVESTSFYISRHGITYRVDYYDDMLFNYISESVYKFEDFSEMQIIVEGLIQELDK